MNPCYTLILVPLTACAAPRTLSPDFGVASQQAFVRQAERASAAGRDYALYGLEGVQIRLRAQEAATAEKSGNIEADAKR